MLFGYGIFKGIEGVHQPAQIVEDFIGKIVKQLFLYEGIGKSHMVFRGADFFRLDYPIGIKKINLLIGKFEFDGFIRLKYFKYQLFVFFFFCFAYNIKDIGVREDADGGGIDFFKIVYGNRLIFFFIIRFS